MLKRGIERNSGYLFQLTSCLLLLFFSLLGLPNLAGADPGVPSSFNRTANNSIGSDIQENLGSVADDKYWKDIFKTNELTGQVKAMVKDNAGNIYIGGTFTTVGGVTVNRIARWDGTQWSALGSGVLSTQAWAGVTALVFDNDGNLYAGGQFINAGGVTVNNIAKWDGTQWSPLGTGFPGSWDGISALAWDGTNLYAGGSFSNAGGVQATNIAKWDGTAWSALGSGLSGGNGIASVKALAWDGTNLYAGGVFLNAGMVTVNHIAKWDGGSWSALSASGGMGGVFETEPGLWYTCVNALVWDGTNLYVGGAFRYVNAPSANPLTVPAKNIAMWNGSAWSALGTTPNDGVNGLVWALALDGTNLYVGGGFNTAGGNPAMNIAKWDGGVWSALGTGIGAQVNAITVYDTGKFYVGGSFTPNPIVTNIFQANYLARWDGTQWSSVTGGFDEGLNATVAALGKDTKGNLYAGGQFGTAGGTAASYIAKWDGTTWSALGNLGNGVSASINALAVDGTNLYVGGWFRGADNAPPVPPNPPTFVPANYIAKWDGTTWSALGTAPNDGVGGGGVYALAWDGTNLYAGGSFATAGGVTVNKIAKWDGTAWSALGTGANVGVSSPGWAVVNALAVDGTNLYVGGQFATAGGVTVNNIAKWNGTQWSALGSGIINGTISALAADGAGNLYVGGTFTFYDADAVKVNNIAKWDGTKWSPLGNGVDAQVSALAFDGAGNLYAGGSFATAGGVVVHNIAKWDGTQWSALGSGVDAQVSALTVVGPGNLFAGGQFALAGGKSSAFIGQWSKKSIYLPLILK
jgi:hypothetical protein